MADREKVIEALDKLADEANPWKESPPLRCDIPYPLLCDTLALLKENEPQSVIFDRQCEVELGYWERKGFCPKCHQVVLWMVNREYCGFCGQKVKWDDT